MILLIPIVALVAGFCIFFGAEKPKISDLGKVLLFVGLFLLLWILTFHFAGSSAAPWPKF